MWGMVLIYLTTVRMIDECGLRGVQTKSDKVKLYWILRLEMV